MQSRMPVLVCLPAATAMTLEEKRPQPACGCETGAAIRGRVLLLDRPREAVDSGGIEDVPVSGSWQVIVLRRI